MSRHRGERGERGLGLLSLLLLLGGCPSTREGSSGPPAAASSSQVATAPSPPLSPSASVLASATVAPVDERIVPLVAGESLAADPLIDGEVYGIELLFELRQRGLPGAPTHLGANAAAILAAQNASSGVLRATLGGGRMRLRFGARAFAMDEGWELRADRRRGGALLLLPQQTGLGYRVVPTGALRPLLSERRIDVVPLGPTLLAKSTDAEPRFGRPVTRTRVTTAWGFLDLDQIEASSAPPSPKPSANKGDARADAESEQQTLDGAGEALCRALLELVAADRAASGLPCAMGFVPVRAEIGFTHGGGLVLEGTSLRDGPIARSELTFPPPSARFTGAPLGDAKRALTSPEALLAIRTKGESTSLDLVDKSPSPRVAVIDGVPAWLLPAGGDARVSLHSGRYVIEWRTPLGEIVERATEIDAPGRATVVQWVPSPLSSASPMASVRNGP